MFGCVVNPPSSWARSLESESSAPGAGAALSYNEALKRTVYMADFFYPAVIPLASSLPAAPLPPGRSSATSRELKFGIDRILGSSKDLSSKDDASKSERTTSPERKVRMAASSASSASPGASSPSERRSPGPRGREGREGPGVRGHTDTAGRTPSAKHCAPSPPFPQDFLHELKFHQPIRQILPSPHDLHHPPLNHPQDLRTRAPEFLTAQDLSGRGFPMCPCPGGSPPAGILPYHPSLHHAVHLAGLHYQSHRSDYEGNYAIMTADLPPHRTHPTSSATPSTQPKRKRSWSRAVFSHLQRKGLEKRFEVQKYVTKPDRKQLAAMLGLTDAQVKVWFQNRRMKWRHAEEAKRKKDESDDITIDETSPNDVTRASPSVDASQDSDDDELCIDDVDDDSSRDNHDDVTLRGDQSGALKS